MSLRALEELRKYNREFELELARKHKLELELEQAKHEKIMDRHHHQKKPYAMSCHRCHQIGHYVADCPQGCRHCGRRGHTEFSCRDLRSTLRPREKSGSWIFEESPGDVPRKRHFSLERDEPVKKRGASDKPLQREERRKSRHTKFDWDDYDRRRAAERRRDSSSSSDEADDTRK